MIEICRAFDKSPQTGWDYLVELHKAGHNQPIPVNPNWCAAAKNTRPNLLIAASHYWQEAPNTIAQSIIGKYLERGLQDPRCLPSSKKETQEILLKCADLPENHHWLLWLWADMPTHEWNSQITSALGRKIKPALMVPGHRKIFHELVQPKQWNCRQIIPQQWDWLTEDPALLQQLAHETDEKGHTAAQKALALKHQQAFVALACISPVLCENISPSQKQRHPGWEKLAAMARGNCSDPEALKSQLRQWIRARKYESPFEPILLNIEATDTAPKQKIAWTWPQKEEVQTTKNNTRLYITPDTISLGSAKRVIGVRISPTACLISKDHTHTKMLLAWIEERGITALPIAFPATVKDESPARWRYALLLTSVLSDVNTAITIEILNNWDPSLLDQRCRQALLHQTKIDELRALELGQLGKNFRILHLKPWIKAVQRHIPDYEIEPETTTIFL